MAVREVAAEEEDIRMGTNHMAAAVTTPVAIPTGMKTCGLDIVVKSNASRWFGCRDAIRLALSFELSRSYRHSGQQHSLFSFHQTKSNANYTKVLEAVEATPEAGVVATVVGVV
jgi:hypothetical protein